MINPRMLYWFAIIHLCRLLCWLGSPALAYRFSCVTGLHSRLVAIGRLS